MEEDNTQPGVAHKKKQGGAINNTQLAVLIVLASLATHYFCNYILPAVIVSYYNTPIYEEHVQPSRCPHSPSPSSPFQLPQPPIIFSPEVQEALQTGRAVVALESTIITHGMPYPQNLETAEAVEEIVRRNGAVPATIAILNGTVHVGMTTRELTWLASIGHAAKKCSRRDIAALVGDTSGDRNSVRGTGATTVAATAYIARLAHPDIRVFVTGGIGGVHRGWESTLDISADLTELGRTDITVVCAGAKSILDIPATLEYLETQGVTVVGYQTDFFPAFFTASTGLRVSARADSTYDVARMINGNRLMRVSSGIVVGVPIDAQDEMNSAHIEQAITQALDEADKLKLDGKNITPFLLGQINNLTKGSSLLANIALVKKNARIGAQIAVELVSIISNKVPEPVLVSPLVVIGGCVVDLVTSPDKEIVFGTSNPGKMTQSMGGVARNIAEGLARLLSSWHPNSNEHKELGVHLITAIASDLHGDMLIAHNRKLHISMNNSVRVTSHSTAVYAATLDHRGELIVAIADMNAFSAITPEVILQNDIQSLLSRSPVVVIDGNLPAPTIKTICEISHKLRVPVWLEPTSIPKSSKIIQAGTLNLLTYISPNRGELLELLKHITDTSEIISGVNVSAIEFDDIESHMKLVQYFQQYSGIPGIIVKMGPYGVIIAEEGKTVHYPAIALSLNDQFISVTGAGDSLVAGTLWALLSTPHNQPKSLHSAIKYGLAAAYLSVKSQEAINPSLSASVLQQIVSSLG